MKKLLWLIVCLMTMVTFTSCGNDIVSKARDNYKQRLTANAKDHEVKLSFNNEKILIQKSDIVVISFTVNANKNGEYETADFISVYAIDENGNIGAALSKKEDWEELISMAKAFSNTHLAEEYYGKKNISDEDVYRRTAFNHKIKN